MANYGKKASKKVEKAMHERKAGTLKSGRSGKKVTSKKQAIAIGLSEARKEGANCYDTQPKNSSDRYVRICLVVDPIDVCRGSQGVSGQSLR